MRFIDLAKNRYTAKKYDPNKKILGDKIAQLKEIIRLCPSSINSQPWKFLFISDENVKRKLAGVSYFNEQKIIDSATIQLFSEILQRVGCKRLNDSHRKAGIKVQALMNAFSGVTESIRITATRAHDQKFLLQLKLPAVV